MAPLSAVQGDFGKTPLRLGLFGGSFNPVHDGHIALALWALKTLDLQRILWLPTPQNPLKSQHTTLPYLDRYGRLAPKLQHPRFHLSQAEALLNTQTTANFLSRVGPILKRHRCVWIMGADCFCTLHRWSRWPFVASTIPIAVFARPEHITRLQGCKAARTFAYARVRRKNAHLLPDLPPPAWVFIPMPLRPESSTALRTHTPFPGGPHDGV